MKKILWALVLLAGCASQPQQTTEDEQAALRRAAIHTELAGGYFGRGQYGVALNEAETAIASAPRFAPAYNMEGLIYMNLGEADKAEQAFRRALSLDPNNSETLNNFGWFLCQRGRAGDSISYFVSAASNPLYSTVDKALTNAGICSLKKGDTAAADTFFQRALTANPLQSQALLNLAEMRYAAGDYSAATVYIDRLLRSESASPRTLWLAIRSARRAGDRNAEASYAMLLRQKFPESDEAAELRAGRFD